MSQAPKRAQVFGDALRARAAAYYAASKLRARAAELDKFAAAFDVIDRVFSAANVERLRAHMLERADAGHYQVELLYFALANDQRHAALDENKSLLFAIVDADDSAGRELVREFASLYRSHLNKDDNCRGEFYDKLYAVTFLRFDRQLVPECYASCLALDWEEPTDDDAEVDGNVQRDYVEFEATLERYRALASGAAAADESTPTSGSKRKHG